MRTYRATVEYDGTRYHGWQAQENARTVAGELRRAFEQAATPAVELGGAGRTDAGVHALAQVAHLRFEHPIDPVRVRERVNAVLPHDIHLLALVPASERFHARHDALARTYVYQLSRRRTAFGKRHVWWIREPLDVERLRDAARRCVGRHDYAAFCDRHAGQTSTLVVVDDVVVAEAGDLVLVRLVASHFLWKMVRRVVGTLVKIATGEVPPATLDALLGGAVPAGDVPGPARWTAPASGLFLEHVRYPGEPPAGLLVPVVLVERAAAAAEVYTGDPAGGPPARRRPARPARTHPPRRAPR